MRTSTPVAAPLAPFRLFARSFPARLSLSCLLSTLPQPRALHPVRRMLSTLRGLRTRARARASEDGWVPLSEQGADWPRAAGRAVPSLLQVALPAVALFLAGATAGYLAFPTYLGPVVLSVSPNPLFAADLSYLKVHSLSIQPSRRRRRAASEH